HGSAAPLHLYSSPTRRSSDLAEGGDPEAIDADGDVDHARAFHLLHGRLVQRPPAFDSSRFWVFHGDLQRHPLFHLVIPFRCPAQDRKSTRLNSSHVSISYAVF